MNTINTDQLLGQLNWRYATKQFDPNRKISDQDWATIEQALLLTPSSGGLQPWKFIVVTDPAVRAKPAWRGTSGWGFWASKTATGKTASGAWGWRRGFSRAANLG